MKNEDEFIDILRLKLKIEFHPDSEVHWSELHEAITNHFALEREIDGKCRICGRDPVDDRWHYFYLVHTRNERFKRQAEICQKLVHANRRELYGQTKLEVEKFIQELLFGDLEKWDEHKGRR